MYNLVGVNGNAYSVMGYVSNAMRESGFSRTEIKEYRDEATSGDYYHLLAVSQEYVAKCNEKMGYDDEDDWEDGEDW